MKPNKRQQVKTTLLNHGFTESAACNFMDQIPDHVFNMAYTVDGVNTHPKSFGKIQSDVMAKQLIREIEIKDPDNISSEDQREIDRCLDMLSP